MKICRLKLGRAVVGSDYWSVAGVVQVSRCSAVEWNALEGEGSGAIDGSFRRNILDRWWCIRSSLSPFSTSFLFFSPLAISSLSLTATVLSNS